MTNKLILGTVQFGLDYGVNNTQGKPTDQKVKEILDAAYDHGIHLLDTAEAYGDSQERIGKYHGNSSKKFDVITKFSATQTQLPSSIIERIKTNLSLLQVNSLYGYMFHSFKDYQDYYFQHEQELMNLQNEGLVNRIGVSLYTNQELEQVLENPKITLIQLPFNLLDNYNLRGEILQKAKNQGVEIHARSVFLQGLFFKNPKNLTGNLLELKPSLQQIDRLCSSNHSKAELALNYSLMQPFIDRVLIGVDSKEQLLQNLNSTNLPLSPKTIDQINSITLKNTELLNPSNWLL